MKVGELSYTITSLGVTLLLFCSCSYAVVYAHAENPTLTAFIPDTDWPPYLVQQESGQYHGLFPDLLHELIEPLGYSISMLRLPNKRGWRMLDAGTVDIHFKAKKWVSNADEYQWSDPLFESEDVLLYSKDRPISFTSVDDLAGLRIAVVESFVYPGLDPLFRTGKAQAVSVDSPFTMLRLVDIGRVDAASVNRAETLWLFREHPETYGSRFALTELATDSASYRIVFSKNKDWTSLIERLNARIAEMKADGRFKALLAKYR